LLQKSLLAKFRLPHLKGKNDIRFEDAPSSWYHKKHAKTKSIVKNVKPFLLSLKKKKKQ
jgi:hypothetical protein